MNDINVEQAKKERNQYVWVPVPDVSEMYGIDRNGKMWGKLYDFTTSTGTGIDPVTGAKALNWSEDSNGVMKIISSSSYREPYIVRSYDRPHNFRQYGVRAEGTLEHLMNLELEFETSIESIAKYGGFYIGRYETGGLNAEAKVVRMDTNISDQSWYSMYEKCKKLGGANENVVTSMIFGSQFDRVLMWLIESNDKTKAQVATYSGEWGNYSNVSLEYESASGGNTTKQKNRSTKIPAGSSEQTKANNIYDLCGNVCEWTIEATGNSRAFRGQCYNYSAGPASYRWSKDPYGDDIETGCRAALYVR